MTEIIWTAEQVITATNGEAKGDNDWHAHGVAMDSRDVQQGDLFIAMMGTEGGLDGHDFVPAAKDAGAVAAIVTRPLDDVDIPQIIVKDSFAALQDLGRFARDRAPLSQAVAITGSVGKTGVRNMTDIAFQGAGMITHASIKSYNNHVGVPFTLANMPATAQVGVFEIGMNHAHEITPLSQLVRPSIAIITWIAAVHIENFDNGIDGIITAKSEIFDGMDSDGVAILPRDNEHYDALVENARKAGLTKIYSFGADEGADARLIDAMMAANGTRVMADIGGERVSYTLQIAGRHIALNSLSALMAVKIAGGDLQAAARALETITPIEGRGNREMVGDDILLVNESYNASPVAMQAAFQVLSMMDVVPTGRRVAILGDMRELGDDAPAMHAALAKPLQQAGIDTLYCCGPHMRALYDAVPANYQGGYYEDSAALAKDISGIIHPHDIVLVKGSLGSKMKLVIDAIRAINN